MAGIAGLRSTPNRRPPSSRLGAGGGGWGRARRSLGTLIRVENGREAALFWLPGAFAVEVIAWEVGSRMGLSIVDPTWEELGRSVQVERLTWGLAGAVVVLFALFLLLSRRRSTGQVSCIQLVGMLALVAYWIGASVVASGAAVMLAAVASTVLSRRPDA